MLAILMNVKRSQKAVTSNILLTQIKELNSGAQLANLSIIGQFLAFSRALYL